MCFFFFWEFSANNTIPCRSCKLEIKLFSPRKLKHKTDEILLPNSYCLTFLFQLGIGYSKPNLIGVVGPCTTTHIKIEQE